MKKTRLIALVLAGMMALSACGTPSNPGGSTAENPTPEKTPTEDTTKDNVTEAEYTGPKDYRGWTTLAPW